MVKTAKIQKSLDVEFHVYVGSVRGALAYSECKSNTKPTYELKEIDGEITAFEWGRSNDELLVGNKNGTVKLYNTGLNKYRKHISPPEIEGTGAVVGLGITGGKLIIGRHDGTINFYSNHKKKVHNDCWKLNMHDEGTMNVMVYNQKKQIIATGGEHNDLKLWDINSRKDVFKAKSLGKDELELPIPTSIRGITFLDEDNLVACCTKEGMLLLYDDRTQRRPVKKYQEPKACFTCIAPFKDQQCFAGTTKGYLQLVDMRATKCVKTFQSFAGAVTSVVSDPSGKYVVSSSLDKHLRVHEIETKELVYKEYMKIALTKVLMRAMPKEEKTEDTEEVRNTSVVDKEYEELFENMETIDESNQDEPIVKRKKRLSNAKDVKKKKAA